MHIIPRSRGHMKVIYVTYATHGYEQTTKLNMPVVVSFFAYQVYIYAIQIRHFTDSRFEIVLFCYIHPIIGKVHQIDFIRRFVFTNGVHVKRYIYIYGFTRFLDKTFTVNKIIRHKAGTSHKNSNRIFIAIILMELRRLKIDYSVLYNWILAFEWYKHFLCLSPTFCV